MDLLVLKKQILSELGKAGMIIAHRDIERSRFADLAIKAFKHKDAVQDVADVVEQLDIVQDVVVSGPYINIHLDRRKFSHGVLSSAVSPDFGKQPKNGKKVILEHTSVNPTGPIHVGRFRNPVIGDSLRRILVFLGYDVEIHYYVNDVGRQVAIIALARDMGVQPDREVASRYPQYADKPDYQTFFIYVPAYQMSEKDPGFKDRINELMIKAESGDVSLLGKLRDTAEFCLEGQIETLKRCGFVYDKFVFESRFIENGRVWEVVNTLKETGKIKQLDNGALAIDLSEFGSPRDATILLRPDGTTVYLTRDVAYHLEKLKSADLVINVLGEDHKVEFLELRTLLSLLGADTNKLDVVHFSFVNLEGKKMSTRRGEIIPLDIVLDEGKERALRIIQEKNPELDNKEEIAEMIGVGALKYSLIKQDPMKKIVFRWEDALDFEGDTAPYIQYSVVRAKSIIRKAGRAISIDDLDDSIAVDDEEWAMVLALSEFPELVLKAGDERKPNIIANYAYQLAKQFNEFYHKNKVIGSEKEEFRLALVLAVSRVLESSLYLLGIDSPDKM